MYAGVFDFPMADMKPMGGTVPVFFSHRGSALSAWTQMMGFIRQQEENLAVKLLKWQYQRLHRMPPDDASVRQQAARVVDEAHRIAKEKGRNVLTIIRELIDDLRRKNG